MIEQLVAAVDDLCAAEPRALSDGDTILALRRQIARLDALQTRALAAFDAGGAWAADGARSSAAWVAKHTHESPAAVARGVHLGRALRTMPVAEQAWLAGDIGASHVSALAKVKTADTEEVYRRDEAMLVDHAKTMRHRHFERALRYWSQLADPDGEDNRSRKQVDGRRLHVSRSFEGCWIGDWLLDPVNGAIVAGELERLERQLFEDDWKEARARVGDRATAADMRRTSAQRRADALVEMATRSRAMPPSARRPEPLFTVYVGYETLVGRICELADGTVVAPGALAPWLLPAWVERIVFEAPSRVIDVGERRRLFTGGLRRALEARDRECAHRDCDMPADRCQADHIKPWAFGGPTVQENGRMVCGFHNRQRNGPPRRPYDDSDSDNDSDHDSGRCGGDDEPP